MKNSYPLQPCIRCKERIRLSYNSYCRECKNDVARVYDRKRAELYGWPSKKIYYMKYSKEKRKRFMDAQKKHAAIARLRWPEKCKARGILKRAIESGRVVKPTKCSACQVNGRIEGHHGDYKKPLEVTWFCVACHRQHHREQEDL